MSPYFSIPLRNSLKSTKIHGDRMLEDINKETSNGVKESCTHK